MQHVKNAVHKNKFSRFIQSASAEKNISAKLKLQNLENCQRQIFGSQRFSGDGVDDDDNRDDNNDDYDDDDDDNKDDNDVDNDICNTDCGDDDDDVDDDTPTVYPQASN